MINSSLILATALGNALSAGGVFTIDSTGRATSGNTPYHYVWGKYTDTSTTTYRHITWKVDIPDSLDSTVAQPAFIQLHGDLGCDEQCVINVTYPNAIRWAFPHKAIGITFAGQDHTSDYYRRLSGSLDGPLLAAAIRGHLGINIAIDTNRVVLHASSSGGAFLDYILQKQIFKWGGGMFIQCGSHNIMSDPIPPDTSWARKYKVFVATTPDDFLYSSYLPILEHAKYWSGFDVRATNAGSGGHCATQDPVLDTAVDWLFGKITLNAGVYAPRFVPHWQGVLSLSGVKGVAATSNDGLWAASSNGTNSQVWYSNGDSAWKAIWTGKDSGSLRIGGIASVGNLVVFSHLRKLYKVDGSTLQPASFGTRVFSVASPQVAGDPAGRIWVKDTVWHWTRDQGSTWHDVPKDWTMPTQFGNGVFYTGAADSAAAPPHFVRMHDSDAQILVPRNLAAGKADSILSPAGRILSSVRKGDSVIACVQEGARQSLYYRVGGVWTKTTWPSADGYKADTTVSASTVHQLGISPDFRLYFMGRPSFMTNASGAWTRMPNILANNVEPTAFATSGRLIRSALNGFGLLVWLPDSVLNRTTTVKKPAEVARQVMAGSPVRRIGNYLELPQEGGPWMVRWIDATGRIRSSATYASASLVSLRPAGAANIPLWVDVEGATTRLTVTTAH